MNINLVIDSKLRIGGGYTFVENFKSGSRYYDIHVVDEKEADYFLIPSSSVVLPETFNRIKSYGKPVVLRVDGFPEDWRNGGHGISRLIEYSRKVDGFIFQSEFSKDFVGRFISDKLGVNALKGEVIFNGVDTSIFNTTGKKVDSEKVSEIIIVNFYRKDPNKRYEEVMYRYRKYWMVNKNIILWIIGRVPTEYMEYNFGFFNDENYKYIGIVQDREYLAKVLRSGTDFWYPSFADPCPNALIEALFCGLQPRLLADWGGSREIVDIFNSNRKEQLTLGYMMDKYYQFFRSL